MDIINVVFEWVVGRYLQPTVKHISVKSIFYILEQGKNKYANATKVYGPG